MKDNIIKEKSFSFALNIIQLYRLLKEEGDYALANQLIRSGTSIGANVEEALAAISKKEFISKMSIASKEARETHYWIRLLRDSKALSINLDSYITDIEELIRILTAIVKSSQQSNQKSDT